MQANIDWEKSGVAVEKDERKNGNVIKHYLVQATVKKEKRNREVLKKVLKGGAWIAAGAGNILTAEAAALSLPILAA